MLEDKGHRPWADHRGEEPRNEIVEAPYNLKVSLDDWGPKGVIESGALHNYLEANWGEEPSAEVGSGSSARAFAGKTLPQVLEGISFWFTIDGVTRACTHQLVRTRFAAVMQHGGRDNDWRHRPWVMPETIRRACLEDEGVLPADLVSPLNDFALLDEWLVDINQPGAKSDTLRYQITEHLRRTKALYAALVDAGIPYQDARRLLPIGTATYLHMIFNFQSLKGFLANRLEHIMDWEINCVSQLMLREIKIQCPKVLSAGLGSHSDLQDKAAFAGLDSWPPDGKYPVSEEQNALPRKHRREQNPFFVLSPSAMAGGPVSWIKTNGSYPEEVR